MALCLRSRLSISPADILNETGAYVQIELCFDWNQDVRQVDVVELI